MDFFFIEYRDPIFGLIVLLSVVFLVALLSFFWGVFSKHSEKEDIEKFVRKFENSALTKEHADLILSSNLNVGTLGALAQVFSKNGDFEKAVSIYSLALQKAANRDEREFLLVALGKIYLKAGFLQRASEVFLEALKLAPRNTDALSQLTIIYEKLRKFKDAKEAINSLEAQGAEVTAWRAYLGSLEILAEEKKWSEKEREILELSKDFGLLKRLILEQAISRGEPINEENLPKIDDCIDLLANNQKFERIRKKLVVNSGANKNNTFNLKMLDLARANGLKAELGFNYSCDFCKNPYPVFFYRCPHCARLGGAKILTKIIEEDDEKNRAF